MEHRVVAADNLEAVVDIAAVADKREDVPRKKKSQKLLQSNVTRKLKFYQFARETLCRLVVAYKNAEGEANTYVVLWWNARRDSLCNRQ